MSDQSPDPQHSEDAGERASGGSTIGAPRWVKVFGIIALLVAVLIAIMLLSGGGPGRHGPGRHVPSGQMQHP